MIEAARLGFVFEFLEPLGHAVKAESVQLFECRMSEHEDFLSMIIAGAAQIGVIEQRGLTAVIRCGFVVLVGEERNDALARERADLERAGGDGFGAGRIDAAIRARMPRQVRKPCSG